MGPRDRPEQPAAGPFCRPRRRTTVTAMTVDDASLMLAGILLLSLIAVESGGFLLRKIVLGKVAANDLQRSFFRAGHAHAGVLLILGLVIPLYLDAAQVEGLIGAFARSAVPAAAIIMPAGFFLSVIGREPERPNRLGLLIPVGGIVLGLGLLAAAVSLIARVAAS